jgi:hypothetical protein
MTGMQPRWTHRPEGSTWGDWGPDDQLGRLNLLTPERVRAAAQEVREGLVFCLSLPLDRPGGNVLSPSRHPPVLRPTLRKGRPRINYRVADENPNATDLICDDAAILHTQYSTHWDAFSHTGFMFDADGDGVPEPRYYNGFQAGIDVVGSSDPEDAGAIGTFEARSTMVAQSLGIERMAATGVQGRGVMIDLHRSAGEQRVVVGYDALMRVLEADGVAVEPGDMVCLHTGYADLLLRNYGRVDAELAHNRCAVLNGRDRRLLQWITDSGLAVLIADNFAVESFPAVEHIGCCAAAPLHEHCLFKLGVHLGELWHLTPLAAWLRQAGRYRFLLTAPPLRLPGATGSPATPIATV